MTTLERRYPSAVTALVCALACGLLLAPQRCEAQEQENLDVFSRWVEWSDGEHMLIHHLNSVAFGQLDRRDHEVRALSTAGAWKARQRKVRETLLRLMGPFPEKTPLNPRVTGTLDMDGYRIEKVVFESRPDFHVTGCLYIPDGPGRKPAILNVIGHTDIAFRGTGYQILLVNLVKKGFVVFAIDPIGQGERKQYWDPGRNESVVGGATSEHSYVGRQMFISGASLAGYFTWDGIRAVDYLLTRPEVDPGRIGITGISGGGTQTSYIWAMDDRLAAAAPTCYITGHRRLMESIGPQDAEQNIYHQVEAGITHADYLEVRAPAPAMIVATTRDFFSIQGARESYAEAARAYEALGAPSAIEMSEDDHGHGYTRKNREAIYGFFRRALALPGDTVDIEVRPLEPESLHVTETGQVSSSLGGESAFSLNARYTEGLMADIAGSRAELRVHLEKVRAAARELSGYKGPAGWGDGVHREDVPVFRGRYQREGYSVQMWALHGEGELIVPLLLFVPDRPQRQYPAIIYLHPDGKQAAAAPGGDIEKLVRQGFVVAAPDPSGIGETADRSNATAFAGVLTGRSVPGIQAADIVRVAAFLRDYSGLAAPGQIGALAVGEMGPALLHAAVFDESIAAVGLLRTPASYSSIVLSRFYEWNFLCAVPGALSAYDLPDLAACLAPRPLMVAEPLDAMKEPDPSLAGAEYLFTGRAYAALSATGNFSLHESMPAEPVAAAGRWMREKLTGEQADGQSN